MSSKALPGRFVYVNKPISIEMVKRANDCDVLDCRCGGEPKILFIESAKPWAEIRCSQCQIMTQMKESPELAADAWNKVMK